MDYARRRRRYVTTFLFHCCSTLPNCLLKNPGLPEVQRRLIINPSSGLCLFNLSHLFIGSGPGNHALIPRNPHGYSPANTSKWCTRKAGLYLQLLHLLLIIERVWTLVSPTYLDRALTIVTRSSELGESANTATT